MDGAHRRASGALAVTRVLSFAKVNLSLAVLGRRPDGYHEIDSIVQTIDLADEIGIEIGGTRIRVDNDLTDLTGRDLAEVAAERILHAKGATIGLRIEVKKRIPAGAGLGGGSSDAGTVLAVVDRLVPPRLPEGTLHELASEIGSDVPIFLRGGRLRVTGRGERIAPAGRPVTGSLVLLVPPIHCETAEVYRRWSGSSAESVRGSGENDLLGPALSAYPALGRYHDAVRAVGGVHAGMSGSGSSFYAAFPGRAEAEGAAAALRERFPEAEVFVCRSTEAGHRIVEGDG